MPKSFCERSYYVVSLGGLKLHTINYQILPNHHCPPNKLVQERSYC